MSKSIQAIDKTSVHRICSGQVVLSLATAVKELVENSVDAGATCIEVRLKEHGSDTVEVVDNGVGVEENNFEGLTLKHHTSKIRDFSDLTSVETFGFRGEALSSLCALSKVTIVTRHKDAVVAHKLEYDHNGKLTAKTPCARQQGTTVILQNLFSTMPVRYKEFQRNLKKEFNKMVNVLNAYCVISTGVKISATNQTSNGKKSLVVSTNANESMRENITNIFGAKQVQTIVEFKQEPPSEAACEEYCISYNPEDGKIFKIQGYISNAIHGNGRSTTDRQFFYINKRPMDSQKVSRIVNEVYHMYNRHQYPFVVLDISIDKESVDVNVTPDKRQIFLQHEKIMYAIIKTSLVKLLEPHASVYATNQALTPAGNKLRQTITPGAGTPGALTPGTGTPDGHKPIMGTTPLFNQWTPGSGTEFPSSGLSNLKRNFSSAFAKNTDTSPAPDSTSKQPRLDSFIRKDSTETPIASSTDSPLQTRPSVDSEIATNQPNVVTIQPDIEEKGPKPVFQTDIPSFDIELTQSLTEESPLLSTDSLNKVSESPIISSDAINSSVKGLPSSNFGTPVASSTQNHGSRLLSDQIRDVTETLLREEKARTGRDDFEKEAFKHQKGDNTEQDVKICELKPAKNAVEVIMENPQTVEQVKLKKARSPSKSRKKTDEASAQNFPRKEVTASFSFAAMKDRLTKQWKEGKQDGSEKRCRAFRAQISPTDNQAAEEELQKEISKDMFAEMRVLGQFNLGFIIAQLRNDLFIIDQHATDEKYNFEQLQKDTVIQSQKLIHPQPLELTAANEAIVADNLPIFHTNGFDLVVNEDAPPTQRIHLLSKPVSKNWEFGKEDIDELIFMLSDSPGVMCRPSRVRMMFASRACRKSIMIGTPLSKPQMKKLILHMGEIEQPWNCPHGRPTMRHLINLHMVQQT